MTDGIKWVVIVGAVGAVVLALLSLWSGISTLGTTSMWQIVDGQRIDVDGDGMGDPFVKHALFYFFGEEWNPFRMGALWLGIVGVITSLAGLYLAYMIFRLIRSVVG